MWHIIGMGIIVLCMLYSLIEIFFFTTCNTCAMDYRADQLADGRCRTWWAWPWCRSVVEWWWSHISVFSRYRKNRILK